MTATLKLDLNIGFGPQIYFRGKLKVRTIRANHTGFFPENYWLY